MTPAAPRDPRVEPKDGDVLRKDGAERHVFRIRKSGGNWFDVYYGGGRRCRCTDSTWRAWAKDAEVIHAAD